MSELSFRLRGTSMNGINELKKTLQNARIKLADYCNINNMYDENGEKPEWNFATMHELEKDIEKAEYSLYCAEYEDKRKRNW